MPYSNIRQNDYSSRRSSTRRTYSRNSISYQSGSQRANRSTSFEQSAYQQSRTSYTRRGYASPAQEKRQREHRAQNNLSDDGARYRDRSRYTMRRTKKPVSKATVIIVVLCVLVVGVGAWIYLNPANFEITVNGQTINVDRGTTLADLLEEGYASPEAGNLLAVDGSVLQPGGGDAFKATVDGSETNDGSTQVRRDQVIYIDKGNDVSEDFSVEEITVSPQITSGGVGSIHRYISGQAGITQRKTGAISGITVDEVVQPAINSGFISYNASTGNDKVISLTFDDGPWPDTTEKLLDLLDQYGIKATFFTIGQQISKYADSVKRASDAGHQICTHSWDHASGSGNRVDLTKMSTQEQINEIEKGYQAIEDATGIPASHVIRSPGGNYKGDIIWTLEPYVDAEIGWNIDTEDWKQPGADAIAQQIMSADSGDIILMHDGGGDRSQTIEALKTALPYLISKGYRFVTIDELLSFDDPASLEAKISD